MTIFGDFIIYFPAATCATWILVMLLSGIKSNFKRHFLQLLLIYFVFSLMEGIYCSKDSNYLVLANAYLVAQIIVPLLIPSVWMLLDAVRGKKYSDFPSAVWLIFPILIFVVCVIVRFLIGIDDVVDFHKAYEMAGGFPDGYDDRIYHVYYLSTFFVFYLVVAVETAACVIYIIYDMVKSKFSLAKVFRFLFKGEQVRPLNLIQFCLVIYLMILFPRILLTRTYLVDHIYIEYIICTLGGIAVTIFSYLVLFSNNMSVSLKGMGSAFDINTSVSEQSPVNGAQPALTQNNVSVQTQAPGQAQTPAHAPSPVQVSQPAAEVQREAPAKYSAATSISSVQMSMMVQEADNDSLSSRFEQLMFKDQLFLTPGLTIIDVAEKLKSNKTYVSRLVNQNYGMAFPDFINSLRIDYAEQYILHNTNAKQKDIAEACGFPSASALNNTFKKVTGLTPKIWLASNLK